MSYDFIPHGDGTPVHEDVVYELEQYPEDKTEKDLERHVAPAIRGAHEGLPARDRRRAASRWPTSSRATSRRRPASWRTSRCSSAARCSGTTRAGIVRRRRGQPAAAPALPLALDPPGRRHEHRDPDQRVPAATCTAARASTSSTSRASSPRSTAGAITCRSCASATSGSARRTCRSRGSSRRSPLPAQDPRHAKFFATLLQDLVMSGTLAAADVVHCHTWYSHFAGCLVKVLQGIPLVLTTHSLEPHRPWKVEQLGTAYHASTWIERTAYENADGVVAVSASMRRDVQALYGVAPERIRVIHNGIDLQQYRPTPDPGRARRVRHRPRHAVRAVRRPHHAAEGDHPPGQRHQVLPSGSAGRAVRGRARHAGDRAGDGRRGRAGAGRDRDADHLDPGDAVEGEGHRALHARGDLRLPVGVRAVRHHQPRGDGVRNAGRRVGGGRDSGGRGPRRDGAARAVGGDRLERTSSRGTRSSSRATSPRA